MSSHLTLAMLGGSLRLNSGLTVSPSWNKSSISILGWLREGAAAALAWLRLFFRSDFIWLSTWLTVTDWTRLGFWLDGSLGSEGKKHPRISPFNILRLRQNGCHFADDIFKYIFLNENVWILIKISLKFVPKCPINNIPALVQKMAWRRPGDKPLSEPMMFTVKSLI